MKRGNSEQLGFSPDRLKRIDQVAAEYVKAGRIAGIDVTVARNGALAHRCFTGLRTVADSRPVERDTLYRIYSMTKPITSAAAMILVEECRLRLTDPISRFFPEFAEMAVYQSGDAVPFTTVPAERQITVRDLLTHTGGLAYGIGDEHPVEQHLAQVLWSPSATRQEVTLRDLARLVAQVPLVHQPGSAWRYSIGIDLLGAIIEEVTGTPLAEFLHSRIFGPLGMHDTFFTVPEEKRARLATVCVQGESGLDVSPDPPVMAYFTKNAHPNGGGGLVSSTEDYLAFAQMLLDGGRGPAENGAHLILSPRTVSLMVRNHLSPQIAGWNRPGMGFGLGGSVMTDPGQAGDYGTPGRYSWGGAAGTVFWIEPVEQLAAVMMIQLASPSSIAGDIWVAVHQALV